MKKLPIVLCIAIMAFATGCKNDKAITVNYDFRIGIAMRNDATTVDPDFQKFWTLVESKGLPIGFNIPLTADGQNDEDVDQKAVSYLQQFKQKITPEELKAINPNVKGVIYSVYRANYNKEISSSRIEVPE